MHKRIFGLFALVAVCVGCDNAPLKAGGADPASPDASAQPVDAAPETGTPRTPIGSAPPRDGDVLSSTQAQVAARLSLLLWNQSSSSLDASSWLPKGAITRADARAFAEVMVGDPITRTVVGSFFRWWLDLPRALTMQKSAAFFPDLDGDLRSAMALRA